MNSKIQKYEYLFPERVYHCPCILVEECFNHGENSIADMIRYLKEFD